ncbi:hypothetical protein [Verminephrobacter aporrectodeae]|uniref:hypothetical protein n=1 Tax=Verminephrobacter aporrectodeae TaxID=1110389 RepID=UPI0038B2D554
MTTGTVAIRYVSPAQAPCWSRQSDPDRSACAVHERARNPACWSGATRNGSGIKVVSLNPERDSVIKTHSRAQDI